MEIIELVGLVAAMCTTAAFLPQVIKSWKTRQTRDISLGWLALFMVGVSLWIVYGMLRPDPVIIVANGATLLLVLALLALKLRHRS